MWSRAALLSLLSLLAQGECGDWVRGFCATYGNELYLRVPRAFVGDPVVRGSLFREADELPLLEECLHFLGDAPADLDPARPDHRRALESTYALLHVRFACTAQGLQQLRAGVLRGAYGRCARVGCGGAALVPVGEDAPRLPVRMHCPCCREHYAASSRHARVLGAAFGPSLPHLLLLRHPDLAPPAPHRRAPRRVFGFRLREEPGSTD